VTDYALYLLSPEGLITSWNAGAERIKGYTAPEVVGAHFSRFFTLEDVDAGMPSRALDTARREGRYEAEGWRCRKDNSLFWAGVVIDAIHDDAGELIGFAKMTRDLSKRREIEIQLDQSRGQLFQLQKMEAVGQLTGGLAHNFNNLLTGITGNLELMQRHLAQGRIDELERYIISTRGAAARAAALTHRLLAFSRQQTLDPRPIDINRLVAGMEELVRGTIGPQAALELILAGGLWNTLIDVSQLESALLNLCINARDAMPNGGRLIIETCNKWLDAPAAREYELPPGQYVTLCISDDGCGMSADIAAHAFDPFFTTKPIGLGTGLGLSMIYGFVRQSGGQVRIESKPGQGTTVRLYLPRHHGNAEDVIASAEVSGAAHAGQGETVLVVDDEPMVRMLVTEVLEDLGYTAIEAEDAAAGLKVLRSGARIDLLVSDVGLPGGMNGRQMADMARAARPDLKVLFITGYAESAAFGASHLAAGMHVLTKPFQLEVLASRIKGLIVA
jgi:PAS domain S-box-containing protein